MGAYCISDHKPSSTVPTGKNQPTEETSKTTHKDLPYTYYARHGHNTQPKHTTRICIHPSNTGRGDRICSQDETLHVMRQHHAPSMRPWPSQSHTEPSAAGYMRHTTMAVSKRRKHSRRNQQEQPLQNNKARNTNQNTANPKHNSAHLLFRLVAVALANVEVALSDSNDQTLLALQTRPP